MRGSPFESVIPHSFAGAFLCGCKPGFKLSRLAKIVEGRSTHRIPCSSSGNSGKLRENPGRLEIFNPFL
ncbi:TPA: hypothetical protein HA351_06055 [Methanosarcinaceae archaeon]|nr:hypothetical protein [Methanosarcinaceae archaeon]